MSSTESGAGWTDFEGVEGTDLGVHESVLCLDCGDEYLTTPMCQNSKLYTKKWESYTYVNYTSVKMFLN